MDPSTSSREAERLVHDTRALLANALKSGDLATYRALREELDHYQAALTIARRREADAVEAAVTYQVRDLRVEGLKHREIVTRLADRGIRSSTGRAIGLADVVRIDATTPKKGTAR